MWILGALATLGLVGSGLAAESSLVIQGKALDGAASARNIQDKVRAQEQVDDGTKVPLAETELRVELVAVSEDARKSAPPNGEAVRRWTTQTDAEGGWTLDTSMKALPPGHALVVSAERDGTRLFSPFLEPSGSETAEAPLEANLYPTTESPAALRLQLRIAYNIQGTEEEPLLRTRVLVQILNAGAEMYVGRPRASGWREVWRLPLPEGARVTLNRGPGAPTDAWRVSDDRRWLILDRPIPGLTDVTLQGSWEVHYETPARQYVVQTYPIAAHMEAQQILVWVLADDMELSSAQVRNQDPSTYPDPFTGENQRYKLWFTTQHIEPGTNVVMAVTVDNAAVGQISESAVRWVGGFVLVLVLALLVGLVTGPRPPAPDESLPGLEGEAVLERIAALDESYERGKVSAGAYLKEREALLELAASELAEESSALASTPAGERGPLGGLPAESQGILRRIDELSSASSPEAVAERAHLLEALAKSLPREAPSS
jgi:hypothetical protein